MDNVNVNTILDSIEDIQEAAYLARESVCEKINDFAEKVAVMEQCGLNVMSEDPTMQFIIDNREQVAYDCNNSVFFDEAYFDESFKSKVSTLLGALIGGATAAFVMNKTVPGVWSIVAMVYFLGPEAAIVISIMALGGSIALGGVIGHKIYKAIRAKNAGSKILRKIKIVCNELVKTVDNPSEKDLKKLKSALKSLIETAESIIENNKAEIPDKARSQMRPLIDASNALIDGVTLSDTKTNVDLLKKFMAIANEIVVSVAEITPDEVEALNAKLKEKVVEASKENAVKESGDCDDKSDDDNEKEEDENAKEEE